MEVLVCDASVMFCDIRNFTVLFENQDPKKAIRFANDVLAVLGNEVEKNGGTVDRFTGDGFLAHFGVQNSPDNHAKDACKAVLDLRKRLVLINTDRYKQEEIVINIGVGIHTGEVAFGNITTGVITQKTILGDTVNTASRIESLTKYFAVDTLASKDTVDRTGGSFKFQKMPLKKLKGKAQPVHTYWLLPTN
ncbi:MAG: adenylate/guanylate cyclase domain-containing protein [Balneolaceae bacterium]